MPVVRSARNTAQQRRNSLRRVTRKRNIWTTEFGPNGTPVLDNFNAGASAALTARTGWSTTAKVFASNTTFTTDAVPSYALGVTAATFYGNQWGTPFEADQEVWVCMGSVVNDIWLYLRLTAFDPAAPSGYELAWPVTGGIVLNKVTAGIGTQIGTATQAFKAGDCLGFSAIGTTFKAWWKNGSADWANVLTISDATWNARAPVGIEMKGTVRMDSFGGGSLSGSANARVHAVRRTWAGR